jgi:putative transposase
MKSLKVIEKQEGGQALAHHNTVFSQLLKLVSRHEFESLARKHHRGRKLRKMTRWSQFVSLGMAQLGGRISLRDVVSNLKAQARKLYHLGCGEVSRSSLSRVNEQQPYTLYEALCGKLLARCQSLAPKHRFRFKNKLYSLDASTIDLCLSVFPWAKFRSTKGAIKLHVGLDHGGHLPAFLQITEGKVHEVNIARTLKLPPGSMVVFDRGYTDYEWYNHLIENKVHFVTRQKKNARYTVIERRPVDPASGITSDQTVRLTGAKAERCPARLRRIGYRDPETGKHYVFLTNAFHLSAKTIAGIYKERWQIELFFKWLKQNLKIKSFLGTSRNAVLTQIWVAICMYLLLAYIKFMSKLGIGMQQILRLLQLNLFERRDLMGLLRQDPPEPRISPLQIPLQCA